MNIRVKQIIESEQLSSSKFADAIGVQRSSISHILSGRNKPSLDVVTRILERFTKINIEWLLLGRGKMYKNENTKVLFTEEVGVTKVNTNKDGTLENNIKDDNAFEISDDISTPTKTEKKSVKELQATSNTAKTIIENTETKIPDEVAKSSPALLPNTEKIILFTSDRKFIEYTPG